METAKPAPRFTALDEVGEGEEWSGDEEDAVEEVRSEISGYLHIIILYLFYLQVIIPGTDWESVNYIYKKFPCEVR